MEQISEMEPLKFDYDTIKDATHNFLEANKLGEGGFGTVYKGILADGQKIAVKRLLEEDTSDVEFENEILLVAKLQHRNLVRLLGFCLQGSERLLVYEFAPNGSLEKFINDRTKSMELDGVRRYKIIIGIARGLMYLHENFPRIIHRDLKAENILLDADMNPEIADFGLAKLFPLDKSHGSNSKHLGTWGYMAPEFAIAKIFSVKTDVYGFGVLILEIVMGKRFYYFCNSNVVEHLSRYAWKKLMKGNAKDMFDPSWKSSFNEMMRCIHIGLLCVQDNAANRPTIREVITMLNNCSMSLPLPTDPKFSECSNISKPDHAFKYNKLFCLKINPKRKSETDSILIDYQIIKDATNKFSEANVIRKGDSDCRNNQRKTTVYEGSLLGGQEIAVKAFENNFEQSDMEFKNQVLWVARLQHPNLVKLLGCCLRGREKFLVYVFATNSSLNHFIFDPTKRLLLDWERCYNIIKYVGQGVLYLDEVCGHPIIHGNLKASNILLDGDMIPKIMGFNIPRSFTMDQTQGKASSILGTIMAKNDVFSFGILILEIVSGRKTTCFCSGENVGNILQYVWKSWIDGTIMNIVDNSLRSSSSTEIERCIHVSLLCVQESVAYRPTMDIVMEMLDSQTSILPKPTLPLFIMRLKIELDSREMDGIGHMDGVSDTDGHNYVDEISDIEGIRGAQGIDDVDEVLKSKSFNFDFNTIRVAVEYFSMSSILTGGFGNRSQQKTHTVHKGILKDGQEIAIKRLEMDSLPDHLKFMNEVLLLAKLQHQNLVRLLGFCLQRSERIIVYEFASNGSLAKFIHDPTKRTRFDWKIRYSIIRGVARGVLHLHGDYRLPIIHLNLKASNILLDKDMIPKITGFNKARCLKEGSGLNYMETRAVIQSGCKAPEYVMDGSWSAKTDVFSFGTLLLEIICAHKYREVGYRSWSDPLLVVGYVWNSWKDGTILNLVDPSLASWSSKHMMRCIQIGLLCVQKNPEHRPPMADVVLMLHSYSSTLPAPTAPPSM